MKTFGFYSPSIGEFVMITADSLFEATVKLEEYNELFEIATDDYVCAGSVRHDRENDINTFNCSIYNSAVL